ncbi:BRCT domain, partial [Sesbania bispinosa]
MVVKAKTRMHYQGKKIDTKVATYSYLEMIVHLLMSLHLLEIELTFQLANFDDKSEQKQLEVNMEMEMQQKTDSPIDSLCCKREMRYDDPGLGANTPEHYANDLPISHQYIETNANVLALNQGQTASGIAGGYLKEETTTVGLAMVDLTTIKPQNSVNSSLVGTSRNFKKENWETYTAPERFRSRWLGGWTCKIIYLASIYSIMDSSIFIYCSFSSLVLTSLSPSWKELDSSSLNQNKAEWSPKFIVRETSFLTESFDIVPDESSCVVKHDPKCAIGSQLSMPSETLHNKPDEGILDSQDVVKCSSLSLTDPLCSVVPCSIALEHANDRTCIDKENDLEDFVPSVSEFEVENFQSITDKNVAFDCRDKKMENNNEENNQHLVDQKSIIEIADDKNDEIKFKVAELTQERRSPLILNHRTRRRLLGPKTVVNDISIEKNIKQYVVPEAGDQHQKNNNLNKLHVECNKIHDGHVKARKQVHFSEKVEELHQKRKLPKLESSYKRCSSVTAKSQRVSKSLTTSVPCMKHPLTNYCRSVVKEFIFQGTEFLLTGLSSQKEKDMELLIRNSGGVFLSDIPSPPNSRRKKSSTLSRTQLPIILCTRKLQTTKFLYGCAVGASILKVDWLTDCLASRTILQPEKYMILSNRNDMKCIRIGTAVHQRNRKHIFERVGIMLHGKHSFCTKLACIIKHGGGQVFKTLQWLIRSTDEERTLVGAIVVEDKTKISRHLKYCALEQHIPMM